MNTPDDTLAALAGSPPDPPMATAIVVGVDGSGGSHEALRWAANQSRLTGRPLHVLHAWQMITPGAGSAGGTGYAQACAVDARAQATRWVLDTLGEHAATDRWTLEIVEGAPGPALVSRSRGAEILVLGAREHTGPPPVMRSSVSHYCLAHAAPIVVAVPSVPSSGG